MRLEALPRLRIRTPEGVDFSMVVASPFLRLLAFAVDLAVIVAASIALQNLINLFALLAPGLFMAVGIVAFFLLLTGYGMVLEYFWRGQTLGKRLLRLRVMDEELRPLRFSQAALRNLLRAVDFLPAFYVVGAVSCLLTRHYQRLGDIASSTVVVWDPRVETPELERIGSMKYNSLRAHPHLCARLRQAIEPEEARAALMALLRRDGYDPEARLEVFEALAQRFRERVRFPEETAIGLTPEQYVRCVVDVLFRARAEEKPAPAPDKASAETPPARSNGP
jgi:uncharacterized RDD family membrane protein YckC